MRNAAPKLLLALLLAAVAGCASFDCNTELPAACPAPQTIAQDAGVPSDLQASCSSCAPGSLATCIDGDGTNQLCTCVFQCN